MPAALDKLLRRSTFFYRCRGVDVVGGVPYMVDSGPHGLHAAMVNFVAPAYGVITMPSGRPGIVFDGATQYATLPLRFYDHAPTTEMTAVLRAYHRAPAAFDRIFNTRNNAATAGWFLTYPATTRLGIAGYSGAGAVMLCYDPVVGCEYQSRTRISVIGMARSVTGRVWHDRQSFAPALVDTADPVNDAAQVPLIGCSSAFGNFFDGTLLTLGLFPWMLTSGEANYIHDMMSAGAI